MRREQREAGFVVSTELMLIALVLAAGLVTGWVKLRDQSLSEIKDSMAAIDAYIQGSTPLWETGGTRWISGGAIEPMVAPAVTESWDGGAFPTAELTSDPGDPPEYEAIDGVLTYTGATAE